MNGNDMCCCRCCRQLRYGSRSRNVKVVTLSGAVIAKNGNITGGSTSYDSRLSHWEQAELDEVRRVTVWLCGCVAAWACGLVAAVPDVP